MCVENFIIVRESRTAHKNDPHRLDAGVLECVPVLARYVYGVPGPYFVLFAAYRHNSSTRDNVIDLFELSMMVRGDRMSGWQDLFGEAALGYSRRRAIDQRSNLGAVSGVDDLRAFTIYDDHRQLPVVSCQLSVRSGRWRK
jgi:hypothetical protein